MVTGTLAGGCLRVGEEIEIYPAAGHARIRSLQTHKKELMRETPNFAKRKFLYRLSRSHFRWRSAAPGLNTPYPS